jgi:hypothetical protein
MTELIEWDNIEALREKIKLQHDQIGQVTIERDALLTWMTRNLTMEQINEATAFALTLRR